MQRKPRTIEYTSTRVSRSISYTLLLIALFTAAMHLHAPEAVRDRARRSAAAWLKGARYEGSDGVTLQTHATNCGPAAMHMALARLGINRPLAEIEKTTGTDARGTSMFALGQYAQQQGLHASLWHLNMSDLIARRARPAIAFVEGNHFVLIDSIRQDGSVLLRDPAIGRLRMERAAFESIWRGQVILLDAP